MKKVLISGFLPFNNEELNSSLEVLNKLEGNSLYHLEKIILNVEYYLDGEKLISKIKEVEPDLIILLGQAGGRRKISFEFNALNIMDASIEDNHHLQLNHQIIKNNGPLAYQTNIDISLIKDIEEVNISYHAGTFICNEIYYRTLDYIYQNHQPIKCGFIHLPYLKSQVEGKNIPFLELENITSKINQIINRIISE